MSRPPNTKLRMAGMLILVAILFGGVFGYGTVRSYFIAKFLAGFGNQTQTVATIQAGTTSWQPAISSVGSIVAVNGADLLLGHQRLLGLHLRLRAGKVGAVGINLRLGNCIGLELLAVSVISDLVERGGRLQLGQNRGIVIRP